jgi:peptidoglycan-N-acetylglucosamine deacetylase
MRRLASAAALALGAYAAPGVSALGPFAFPGIVKRLPATGAVAVTFDDGPHPLGTPAVLDELERLGLGATFFLVGREVRKHPELVRELVDRGHEPALHADRHLPQVMMPPWWVMNDLTRARACLEDVAGVRVERLRAPFGAASLATLAYARRAGLELVSWSRWGRDWEPGVKAEAISARISRGLQDGDIVLLHDSDAYAARGSWRATVAALPPIAERLAELGLRGRSLAELSKR